MWFFSVATPPAREKLPCGGSDGNQIVAGIFYLSGNGDDASCQGMLSEKHVCSSFGSPHIGHDHTCISGKSAHGNLAPENGLNQLAFSALWIFGGKYGYGYVFRCVHNAGDFCLVQKCVQIFSCLWFVVLQTNVRFLCAGTFEKKPDAVYRAVPCSSMSR